MNKVGQILLLGGAIVLALLIGVLIGRGQRIQPTSDGNAAAVQITTAPPPSAPAPPLPAPVSPVAPPQAAVAPKPAPDLQVQEDAAAVGMTTREPADQASSAAPGASGPGAAADAKPAQPKG